MGTGLGTATMFCFLRVRLTSLQTLLPLYIPENLEIHAQDGRVWRNIFDHVDGALEQGGESGFCEPGIAREERIELRLVH
jgi:hypothetical protein